MRPPFRSTRMLALALAATVVPVSTVAAGGQSVAATSSGTLSWTALTVTAAPQIPDTPAGRQLTWFLDALSRTPVPESELREHFAANFLQAVSADEINKFAVSLKGLTLQTLTEASPTSLYGTAKLGGEDYVVTLTVDGDGKINGLRVQQPQPMPPAPKNWRELDSRMRSVAPNVGFLAAEIDSRGRCQVVHGVNVDKPRPLGSIFKLYVLGAVAEKIRDGGLRWDTELTIKPEWKSPSEGGLWERPDNSKVTVREAAKLMISISDNTAADILIHTVGRRAVEAKVRQWSDHPELNVPFLTTKELFLLKGIDHPRQARTYLSLSTAKKRKYLRDVVAKQDGSTMKPWTTPREVDTIEWFGSPRDVCRAYVGLTRLNSKTLNETLSGFDGLGLDAKKWPTVWFKGGSEPGLLDLAYLGRSASGRTYVVTALAYDKRKALPEEAVANQLVSLVKGSFSLVKSR
ncbi:serine hydrolase [Streptosporangium sp. NPDC001559]|uniref:serine hydrolase n=1 Tax=Streptosporangium sp. NPDC001559 TaxID=3366187 RepID=UPI0036EA88B4